MENESRVTVIIPVYNAYESLKKCIDSVLAYTDFASEQLLLIDDKSSDEKVLPYLKSLQEENQNVILMENERNEGFVKTVNRAVSQVSGDVVLLNSDTIVSEGWIHELKEAAYSRLNVATVTPLSNNASHCTIPMRGSSEDSLEERIAMTSKRVGEVSFRSRPNIGVGVGFCMYIRRDAWDAVGPFDAKAYGKGYGEEVDFCLRAEQLGYQNILCDSLFVYHEGTASFSLVEKNRNLSASDKVLKNQYTAQFNAVLKKAGRTQDTDWYKNIQLHYQIDNGRKNILYLLQADFRPDASNNVGGTQFHVKDLVLRLKDTVNVFVMARDREYLRLTVYTREERISFKFYIGPEARFPVYHDSFQKKLYEDILKTFKIDIVHIHHTYSLTLDLYDVACELKIPLLATLHDFYTVCPTIKLLENGTQLCVGNACEERCRKCLNKAFAISENVDFLKKWRYEHLQALKKCIALFAPSESAKGIILEYYPELNGKIQVIPHGYDRPCDALALSDTTLEQGEKIRFHIESSAENFKNGEIFGWCYLEDAESTNSKISIVFSSNKGRQLTIPVATYDREDLATISKQYKRSGFSLRFPKDTLDSGTWKVQMTVANGKRSVISEQCQEFQITERTRQKKFRVAFIGGLNEAKGSQIAYKMIKKGNNDIEWVVMGGIGDRDLADLEQENLFKTSWYQREDLKALFDLYQIDVVCILPIWPETFCYTLSEAVVCGRPVLVSDLGALGERMRKMNCGWIVPPCDDATNLLEVIESIRKDTDGLKQMTIRAQQFQHESVEQMTARYEKIYDALAQSGSFDRPTNTLMLYQGYLLGEGHVPEVNHREDAFDLQRRVQELETQLSEIQASLGYRVVVVFQRLNIPFKKQIKKLVFWCYKMLKRMGIA